MSFERRVSELGLQLPPDPFGRVPSEVSLEEAQLSARAAVLAMLGALRARLGSLVNLPVVMSAELLIAGPP
ncbi:MAG: hypothetical protein ACRDU5_11270 [Mycobacterium sp.]